MQTILEEKQLYELKNKLYMAFSGCELLEKSEIRVCNSDWNLNLEDFLMSKSLAGKSPETINRYSYELKRLLSYINKPISDIVSEDINRYMRMYKSIRRISNTTLKNVRAIYSSFFSWLRDRNKIGTNPMLLVEEIKVERKIKEIYTDEQRELLLRACKTLRDRAIMEVLYSTAIRVSELIKLNRYDIKITKDLIVFGKGKKERRVYLNDRANLYLREYMQSRTDDNPALFVSTKKPYGRLGKDGVESMIRRTGNKIGITNAYPHKFRRTSITNALNRGMPLQEAAELAGHADTSTTKLYWSKDEEAIRYHHKIYLSA